MPHFLSDADKKALREDHRQSRIHDDSGPREPVPPPGQRSLIRAFILETHGPETIKKVQLCRAGTWFEWFGHEVDALNDSQTVTYEEGDRVYLNIDVGHYTILDRGESETGVYVELQQPLEAAEEFSTERTTALAKRLRLDEDEELVCTDDDITIVNRYSRKFAACDRVMALPTEGDVWHVLPIGTGGDSLDCLPMRGRSLWRVEEVDGKGEWVLVKNGCCDEFGCHCNTTTPEPSSTTSSSTTTTEDCCKFDPAPPNDEVTIGDVGTEKWTCCVPGQACGGSAIWNYDVETGEWTPASDTCDEGCEPARPPADFCPNEDSCTKTKCVREPCGTTTTSTTGEPCPPGGSTTTTAGPTTTPGPTTTCDPDCYPDPDGCDDVVIPKDDPPGCDEDCSFTCGSGGWYGGGGCCGDFVIGRPGCVTNPPRVCIQFCAFDAGIPCNFSNCGQVIQGTCKTFCPPGPSPCGGTCRYVSSGNSWHLLSANCGGNIDCAPGGGCGCGDPGPADFDPCGPLQYAEVPCECSNGQVDLDPCKCTTVEPEGPPCCPPDGTTTEEPCKG
jgi:hypothetical protein